MNGKAALTIFDLVSFNDAADRAKLSKRDILKAASKGTISLFHPVKQCRSFMFEICEYQRNFDHVGNAFDPGGDWYQVRDYDQEQQPIRRDLDLKIGDVLKLDQACITSLFTSETYSELDVLTAQLETCESILDQLRTDRCGGPLKWKPDFDVEGIFSYEDTYLIEDELNSLVLAPSETTKASDINPKDTALKVIGLLMLHLAKTPKYAVGANPNKSEIKKLLQSLADEFDVKEFGLSKVDERLLPEAMKHLEEQKK